jgi:beta-glucosidase-like glycosyl hydrolase
MDLLNMCMDIVPDHSELAAPEEETKPRSLLAKFMKPRTIAMCVAAVLAAPPIVTLGTLGTYALTRPDVEDIEFEYEGHTFSIEDMILREKVAQLLHGSSYNNRMADLADRSLNHRSISVLPNFTDWLTDWLKSDETVGGVHLFRSDARTLEETRRSVIEVMAKSEIPPFVSMDIVGGYTRHLGITLEEAREYGVPERFALLAEERNIELPSQEDLGKLYESLETNEERIIFMEDMMSYGEAIAKICRATGIVVNFGPVMDLVDNVDGDNFMAKNDEAYSDKITTVQVLAFYFQKGFQNLDYVLIVPKHYAGTGMIEANPHQSGGTLDSSMGGRDGSVLPFLDSIHGELFHNQLSRGHGVYNLLRDTRSREANANNYPGGKQRLVEKQTELRFYGLDVEATSFTSMDPVRGIMVGHADTFISDGPGSLSSDVIDVHLKNRLGFQGLVWTDDLSMSSVDQVYYPDDEGSIGERDTFLVDMGYDDSKFRNPENSGERFVHALQAGATLPMLLHASGDIGLMTFAVEEAIDNGDLSMEQIDARVAMVLDEKVRLGLLEKTDDGHYVNCSRAYLIPDSY